MRVLVLGAAVSGLAAARLGRRLGHSMSLYDRDPGATTLALGEGFGISTGEWDHRLLDGIDVVVTSPGLPERSAPITDVLEWGIPLWSEIEFGWRELDIPTVAVTGTNGKTTVTGLIADMLIRSGRRTEALGNIGNPLCDAVGKDLDLAVVEVSSFQLRFIERFRPQVAVVTNVAPDHLDWHGSYAGYVEAKARIALNQDSTDLMIFDTDDEGAASISRRSAARLLPVSARRLPPGGAGVDGGRLVWEGGAIRLDELAVDDIAFVVDVALAGAAALAVGADPAAVNAAAAAFRPGVHRRTVVGEIDGVRFVDDSKATNPHAAVMAIRSYESVVLIAGGLAKGLDVAPLATEPNVRNVIAIGEAAPTLLAAAGARGRAAATMEEAVERGAELARPGDVVLLAPGCASFDMFDSYAARGDRFAAAVRRLRGSGSNR